VPSESESITTDALLSDLIGNSDEGSQLMIDELSSITSTSEERLYKWLHTLAGLILDFSHSATTHEGGKPSPTAAKSTSLGKKPSFTIGANYLGYLVSTKAII